MKKIAIVVAMLALATPVMAVTSVKIDACDIGSGNAAIIYQATGGDVSGFGLNVTLDSGATIEDVVAWWEGEANGPGTGYGIFPGRIVINATTGDVCDYGSPDAPNDAPGALGGIDTSGVTLELGALYTTGKAPNRAGTLCTIAVSDDCNLTLALNTTRGGVVDVNAIDATVTLKGPRHIAGPVGCGDCAMDTSGYEGYGIPDGYVGPEDAGYIISIISGCTDYYCDLATYPEYTCLDTSGYEGYGIPDGYIGPEDLGYIISTISGCTDFYCVCPAP